LELSLGVDSFLAEYDVSLLRAFSAVLFLLILYLSYKPYLVELHLFISNALVSFLSVTVVVETIFTVVVS
jgi:hypothetical protein